MFLKDQIHILILEDQKQIGLVRLQIIINKNLYFALLLDFFLDFRISSIMRLINTKL